MTKNKGKKHSQHRNTSDKYAAKIIEPEQVIALGASANVDKKLLRQLEKQKKDEEYAATAREAEQKKSAELKKKQKANKGNTPKKRIEIPPSIQPLEIPEKGGFKGASENKESDESQRAAGFRGSTSKSSTFNDNKHPRVHGPSYGLQKQDGPERDFRGDVTKFSAPYKYPRVEAPYYNKYGKTYDQSFKDFMQKKNIKCDHIKENIGDLFSAPDEYSLAHCVAEDFNMGAGIALTFRAKYKQVSYLLNQNQRTGGLAVLKYEKRFIYYLVTKQVSRGKPTLHTLWQSLQKLRQHCEANNVTKLAMPQIGCGLDKLDWNKVKQMLAYVFEGTSVEIVVYVWDKSAKRGKQQRGITEVHSQNRKRKREKEILTQKEYLLKNSRSSKSQRLIKNYAELMFNKPNNNRKNGRSALSNDRSMQRSRERVDSLEIQSSSKSESCCGNSDSDFESSTTVVSNKHRGYKST